MEKEYKSFPKIKIYLDRNKVIEGYIIKLAIEDYLLAEEPLDEVPAVRETEYEYRVKKLDTLFFCEDAVEAEKTLQQEKPTKIEVISKSRNPEIYKVLETSTRDIYSCVVIKLYGLFYNDLMIKYTIWGVV